MTMVYQYQLTGWIGRHYSVVPAAIEQPAGAGIEQPGIEQPAGAGIEQPGIEQPAGAGVQLQIGERPVEQHLQEEGAADIAAAQSHIERARDEASEVTHTPISELSEGASNRPWPTFSVQP